MTTKKEMTRLITEYCKALRLPSTRRLFETEIAEVNLVIFMKNSYLIFFKKK